MNEQNIYELEQYFSQLIEKSLGDLREDLLDKMNELLQNLNGAPDFQADLSDGVVKAGADDFGSKTFDAFGDVISYAAISAVLPNINSTARLPRGLDGSVVFRPALRRVGTLAGKTIASTIFDTSGGKISYGSRQLGSSIFAELFSG